MTLTNTEAVTDLSILEALDFDPQWGCEHSRHADLHPDEPGWALVSVHTPCGCDNRDMVTCRWAWDRAGVSGLKCRFCGLGYTRGDVWTILKVLR